MNALTTFDFIPTTDAQAAPIRTLTIDGEPWFVAKDVAEVLGYADTKKAIQRHCKGGTKRPLLSDGGLQETTVIPERDLDQSHSSAWRPYAPHGGFLSAPVGARWKAAGGVMPRNGPRFSNKKEML